MSEYRGKSHNLIFILFSVTIYFILVVNSHRKALVGAAFTNKMGSFATISNSIKSTIATTITFLNPVDEADPETVKDQLKALRKASGIKKTKIIR